METDSGWDNGRNPNPSQHPNPNPNPNPNANPNPNSNPNPNPNPKPNPNPNPNPNPKPARGAKSLNPENKTRTGTLTLNPKASTLQKSSTPDHLGKRNIDKTVIRPDSKNPKSVRPATGRRRFYLEFRLELVRVRFKVTVRGRLELGLE